MYVKFILKNEFITSESLTLAMKKPNPITTC